METNPVDKSQIFQPKPLPPGEQGPKDNKKLIIIIAAVVVGLSVLGWVGNMVVGNLVGFGMRKAIEAGTGMKIDDKGGTVTFQGQGGQGTYQFGGNESSGTIKVTDEKGQVTEITTQGSGAAKTLPSAFPSDFPVMGGMTLDSTTQQVAPDGSVFIISWKTSSRSTDVAQWETDHLKSAGWNITMSTDTGTESWIYFDRGPADAAQRDGGWFTISTKDSGTEVALYLTIVNK